MAVTPPTGIRVPLYGQVLGVLRQRILDGTYATGDQLQAEDRLSAEFGVSRATIRQAVGELVAQGLVDRKQGRGTFVLERREFPTGLRYSGSLDEHTVEPVPSEYIEVDVARRERVPPHVADVLRLEEPVATVVRRIKALKREPFAYSINYVQGRFGDMITKKSLAKATVFRIFELNGVKLVSGQQVIRAELADMDIAPRLNVDFGAPVLYAERVVFSVDEEPIQVMRAWYRSDLYEYRVTMKPLRLSED